MKKTNEMVDALIREITLRKNELNQEPVETIYFGGGTPSVLSQSDIDRIIDSIGQNYQVVSDPEITLEANPDDLTKEKIIELSNSKVNRISIGVQSFFESDLKLMNRAHNAQQAIDSLKLATQYFENISLDLIYGIPGLSNKNWKKNIAIALSFGIPHISSYALTVEPNTALQTFINKGIIQDVDDDQAQDQFHILVKELDTAGFVHYELSNFGKEGFFSKNNSSYWQGKPYLGVGPSAHSFDGTQRSWNVRNNPKYIKSIQGGILPIERETLSKTDCYNEYVMTGLRTIWGVSLIVIEEKFGVSYLKYIRQQSEKYILEHLLYIDDGILRTTQKGKFLSDGIASDLFMLNLN